MAITQRLSKLKVYATCMVTSCSIDDGNGLYAFLVLYCIDDGGGLARMNAGAYSSVTACVSSARDYFEHVIVLVTYNHDRILNLIVLVTDLLMSSLYNHRALAVDGKGDFFKTKFGISSECCWSQNVFNWHQLHY